MKHPSFFSFISAPSAVILTSFLGALMVVPVHAEPVPLPTMFPCEGNLNERCTLIREGENITEIRDFLFDDILWNISFIPGIFNDLFDPTGQDPARKVPTFWENQIASQDVAIDLIKALGDGRFFGPPGDASYPTAQGGQGFCEVDDGPGGCDIFLIPYQQNGSTILSRADAIDILEDDSVTPISLPALIDTNTAGLFVQFQTVPEPTSGLTLLGLAGFGLMVSRHQRSIH